MMLGKGASVAGLLMFGTTTSLLAKIVYELQGEGISGEQKYFRKPWAMTTIMFIGMTLCLPLAYLEKKTQKQSHLSNSNDSQNNQKIDKRIPLLDDENYVSGRSSPISKVQGIKEILMLSIPAIFDLVATVLMNIGLLTVTASVYQMMRGAEMIFAAIFATTFLRRKLNRLHYLGISASVLGIGLVGMASVFSGEGAASAQVPKIRILTGMLLIIASQCVQAAQVTFEDFFMTDMHMEPLMIVGYEGLFGSIMMIGILLPIVSALPGEEGNGIHEDTLDTLHMIAHSNTIPYILGLDMFALMAYNWTGMHVTGHLGAVFRTVLETMRTLFVWIIDLILFQLPFIQGALGEKWNIPYSFLQLLGFGVLVSGTVVYGKGDEKEIKERVQLLIQDEEEWYQHQQQQLVNDDLLDQPTDAVTITQTQAADIPIRFTPSSLPKSSMNISAGSYQAQLNFVMQHTPSFQRHQLHDGEDDV
eukprot:TRINITY_DN3360_c0_g3_i2.p1 TRINITY_DN3360_c0_g3~~TRINITY_DN3360_c0_g3_i2.p1  ORF type:complete len:541 (+),score=49.39 TRINITY_DN3360_c0_g3_i2:204-1625(+)